MVLLNRGPTLFFLVVRSGAVRWRRAVFLRSLFKKSTFTKYVKLHNVYTEVLLANLHFFWSTQLLGFF